MVHRFILRKKFLQSYLPSIKKPSLSSKGYGVAPVNIALVKYWGKRDEALHLPQTDSLSISLSVYTKTSLFLSSEPKDQIIAQGKELDPSSAFFIRTKEYLDLFRPSSDFFFRVETDNDVPTAAGLASSASGFASLARAIDALFELSLSSEQLSVIARLGSGSACRSIYPGFVRWKKGISASGEDSFAIPIKGSFPKMRFGILLTNRSEKPISSKDAMRNSLLTSPAYQFWPSIVENDMNNVQHAIDSQNFQLLGETAEKNALYMHMTMQTSSPPLCYWNEETLTTMQKIFQARRDGHHIFFTLDAGPNVKILYPSDSEKLIDFLFPSLWKIPLLF